MLCEICNQRNATMNLDLKSGSHKECSDCWSELPDPYTDDESACLENENINNSSNYIIKSDTISKINNTNNK